MSQQTPETCTCDVAVTGCVCGVMERERAGKANQAWNLANLGTDLACSSVPGDWRQCDKCGWQGFYALDIERECVRCSSHLLSKVRCCECDQPAVDKMQNCHGGTDFFCEKHYNAGTEKPAQCSVKIKLDGEKVWEEAKRAATEFRPGDVVQLKSGGPAMTVFGTDSSGSEPSPMRAACLYMDKEGFMREVYVPFVCLRPILEVLPLRPYPEQMKDWPNFPG